MIKDVKDVMTKTNRFHDTIRLEEIRARLELIEQDWK